MAPAREPGDDDGEVLARPPSMACLRRARGAGRIRTGGGRMMPDLGKYAETVLSAYAVSIVLLVAIVALSLWRGRRVRAQMIEAEKRAGRLG